MTNITKHWHDKNIRIREDRYVSLTDMAQATGKNVNDFLRLDKTKSYLEALSSITGYPVMQQNQGIQALLEVRKGGDVSKSGTWAYPKVAIRFAQWCNDDFAIWVDTQIDELMTTGKVELIPQEAPKKAITYYSDRVADIRKNLIKPKGRWCVIEKCNHLLLEVEKTGYPVDKFDLLDSSVGRRWSDYRKSLGLPALQETATYRLPHCPAPISIACYPNSELGIFSEWLEEIYEAKYLSQYLQSKYGKLAHLKQS